MISKIYEKPKTLAVVTLQLPLHQRYQENLDLLLAEVQRHQDKALIIAPEVCLTGFDYAHMVTASKFSNNALKRLKKEVNQQILVFTVILEEDGYFINQAVVIHKHKIIHTQEKAKLFALGDEHRYFKAGQQKRIKPFEIEGVSYALLICFELRFKDLWKQVEGADVILIPSRWGKSRKNHLEILSKALAVMNQCFVLLANASDEEMASSSAIISPFGNTLKDDKKQSIESTLDLTEIQKMRRYIVL
jgi:predicted amidohydrolase